MASHFKTVWYQLGWFQISVFHHFQPLHKFTCLGLPGGFCPFSHDCMIDLKGSCRLPTGDQLWLNNQLPKKKKRRHWHGQTGQVGGGAWRPAMSGLTICLPTVRPGVPKKKNKKVEQQFTQVRWDGGGGKVGNSGLNICKGRTPKVFVVDNGTEAFYFGVS